MTMSEYCKDCLFCSGDKCKREGIDRDVHINTVACEHFVGDFFGISTFNESIICFNKGVVYEHKMPNNKGAAQSYKTLYNIYLVNISKYASSKVNYPIAVVTEGHVILPSGELEIYIKPGAELLKGRTPMSSPACDKLSLFQLLTKNFRIPVTVEEETPISQLVQKAWAGFLSSSRVFELTTPVPLDELKKLKDVEKAIESALTDGLTKDSALLTFMKAHIPKPDPALLSPNEYMAYAPNGIVITKTKTGKSTTAERISRNVVHRPTAANLLGFSTSDETHIGLLDGQVDTCFVDEYTENLDENVSQGLLSYMETGTTKTARGKGITARGFSPIAFMGNPKKSSTEFELLDYFRANLNQISNNHTALGSRIGFSIFDNDMEAVKGTAYDYDSSIKSLKILKTFQEAYKKQFSELFRNSTVLAWLNTPFDKWYRESLDEMESKATLNEVRDFIRGLKDSHKHLRGTALHIAFVDSYEILLTEGSLNIQDFIEKSNQWYQHLITYQLDTLRRIISIKLNDFIYANILDTAHDYIGLFVKTTFYFENLSSITLPVDSFETKFSEVKADKGRYVKFSNLRINLLKNITKSNEFLKTFGLKLTNFNDIVLVQVFDKELYEKFRVAYIEKVSSLGTLGAPAPKAPEKPDFSMGDTLQITELSLSLDQARTQWERGHGVINSANMTAFSLWFCETFKPKWSHNGKSGDYTPSGIRAIAEKVFKITPEAGR